MISELVSLLFKTYLIFVIIYFLVVNVIYALFLAVSFKEILHHMRRTVFIDYRKLIQSEFTYSVSIVAPAFNEAETVVESVQSLLKLNFGKYEVLVINDGSTDDTSGQLIHKFELIKTNQFYYDGVKTKPVRGIYKSQKPEYKNLTIVDKENGGKADALNAGINTAQYDHVCCIDADSILEDDALLKSMKPFHEDRTVVAVGGIIRIANGCKVMNGRVVSVGLSHKLLPIFQVVEYFRAFLSGRMFWNIFQGPLIISGAFGIFKKSILLEVGGYRTDTVGEDMELVTRIHRIMIEKKRPYKILFIPDPVCWTEAPDSLSALSQQRNRWHRGLFDTLLIHKKMIFNPTYGMVGVGAMPHFLLVELLGPVFEAIGYISLVWMYYFGVLNIDIAILFFIVSLFYGTMFSVGAVILEEISFQRYPKPSDLALLLSFGIIENFGYRQLTVWWRLKGIWNFLRGNKHWGSMQRKGFGTMNHQQRAISKGK
jgi:cellulose synthase/poly-beta-1,6-N-acetylglucosamine synthase-like glycosyltransferase